MANNIIELEKLSQRRFQTMDTKTNHDTSTSEKNNYYITEKDIINKPARRRVRVKRKNPTKSRKKHVEVKLPKSDNKSNESIYKKHEETVGGIQMSEKDFVTDRDLQHVKEKNDLKLENVTTKIDGEFKVTNSKIDSLSTTIDNKIDKLTTDIKMAILEEREYQNEKSKETNRFIWGTIVIGVLGLIFTWVL